MTLPRWTVYLIVVCTLATSALAVLSVDAGRAGAVLPGGVAVTPSTTPAFNGDAPDPDVVSDGSEYFAFTTGTTLAGYLQALCHGESGSLQSGWTACPGPDSSASALPSPPSWEQPATQNAPGAYLWHGTWIMFYTASLRGHPDDSGANCLSVATNTDLSPSDPVFTDDSTAPLLCDAADGGAIDPCPFVDPTTGQPYLIWKTNDGGSDQSARLWSQPLGPNGTTLIGQPSVLETQDSAHFPFETTIENPQMVDASGNFVLLFSAGAWNSTSYSEVTVPCAGPLGPCDQPTDGPFLTSYDNVAGPAGGTLFQDGQGNWYLAYAAWTAGCTDYSCGGRRRFFVAPATITPFDLPMPTTGIASSPDGQGYWIADAEGDVSAYGSATFYGSMAGKSLNAPVLHVVPTADGLGYWLVAADGGIFAYGDARFFGSMGGRPLNAPVVDLAPTPDDRGYWLVAADGGVFAFGDARFYGSMGGRPLNRPVVGIATSTSTGGYWLVAADGGVFAFDAPFYGSTGAIDLKSPVDGMASTLDGDGYWFVAGDGGVFAFGDAGFHGSAADLTLAAPIVGMAADPVTGGYWLLGSDGGVFAYASPFEGTG